MIKKACLGLLRIIFAAVIAIVVLSAFTLVYWYDGIHITNPTGATDYTWRSKEHIATMTEGFAWLRMNEAGFNNADSYSQADILFMGSSHTDDLHFPREKNAAVLVNQMTGMNTYNIGMSGHTIYRCVDNLKNALSEYHPKSYIVLETASIELATEKMNEVISEDAEPIESYDSGIMYHLQQVPALKPIFNQLKQWIENDKNDVVNNNKKAEITDEYLKTLNMFLSIVQEEAAANGITAIIYYHPAEKLMADGSVQYKTNQSYLEAFAQTCEALGIIFVDMTQNFHDMYITDNLLAHGFVNTKIGAGHLNEYGHRAIAETISEVILETEVKYGD